MAKAKEEVNEVKNSFEGCYGNIVDHCQLDKFLDFNFKMNQQAETNNKSRFAQCIWGNAGIGKTTGIKSYRNKEIKWNGELTKWKVHDVPIAQFEEMGDFHGLPTKCFLMRGQEGERWVSEEHILDYKNIGWVLDLSCGPKTYTAPPEWIPNKPGPSILLLDDFNRSSLRILKGIMQLLQNYGMISWQLPLGCNIVLTGNPDMQDYSVASLDSAILTRIKHITLKPDIKIWTEWALNNDLDIRGIQWINKEEFYLTSSGSQKMTNPRTLAEFFNILKHFKNGESEEIRTHALSLIDTEAATSFMAFLATDYECSIDPEDILTDTDKTIKRVNELLSRPEPRNDVVSVTFERLLNHISNGKCDYSVKSRNNFHKFLLNKNIPKDLRHSFMSRLSKRISNFNWIQNNEELTALITETMRKN